MTTIGTVQLLASIDTSKYKQGAAEIDKTNKHLEKSGDATSSRMSSGFSTAAKVGVAAFAAATTAVTIFAVKSAASFEQTRIGIENMLGSSAKARKLLEDISGFAAQTPFEFPELAQSARQLLAFGFNAKDAFDTMKQLGDVSAAVGAPIGDLAYLMGTLKTQGKAMTIDIRQFAQRGIPIYEYLAKVMGKNTKQVAALITEGKVGFPEVQKAFAAMTGEGGKFFGTMSKQSKSLSGLWSTLKDNAGFLARELIGIKTNGDIIAGSIFDNLRNAVGSLITGLETHMPTIIYYANLLFTTIGNLGTSIFKTGKQISDYLAPKLGELWTKFQELLPTLQTFYYTYLVPIGKTLGQTIVVAIGLAIEAMTLLVAALKPTFEWLNKNKGVVEGVVVALGAYYAAMKLIALYTAFVGAINTMGNAMILFRAKMVAANTQMGLFKVLMGSPFVLTIVVAAALLALAQVYRAVMAIKDAMAELNNLESAQRSASSSQQTLMKGMQDLRKNGTPAQKKRANAFFKKNNFSSGAARPNESVLPFGLAKGTDFWKGGPTWVGEKGPEILNLPRGSQVIPNDKASKMGGGVTVQVNMSGIMARSRADLRDITKDMIRSVNEELKAKQLTPIGGGAI